MAGSGCWEKLKRARGFEVGARVVESFPRADRKERVSSEGAFDVASLAALVILLMGTVSPNVRVVPNNARVESGIPTSAWRSRTAVLGAPVAPLPWPAAQHCCVRAVAAFALR